MLTNYSQITKIVLILLGQGAKKHATIEDYLFKCKWYSIILNYQEKYRRKPRKSNLGRVFACKIRGYSL